ncbi:MAG TPA: LysR substrate-binding domain-containing protein, partial [Spongiibacteraceae bacterium]|nr:LysR substrate-binding domain-containing protein [Spongiibacteraceae bacterium]
GTARDVLDRARDIETMARGETAEFDLHLGATVTIGNHLVPGLVARLRRDYPNSRVRISRYNTEQLLAQVNSGQIDLGFIEGPGGDDSIRRLTWRQDWLVIFAAPGHPLVGSGRAPQTGAAPAITPGRLSEADWIVRERGSGTRQVMDRALLAAGVKPRIAFELEQPEAIRQCVKAGLGIGCLSALELEDAFRAGTLVPLATPFLDMRRNLDVVLHRRKYLSRGIAAILQECGIDSHAEG